MISSGRIEEVNILLTREKSFISFVIEMLAKSYNLKKPKQKENAFNKIRDYLNELSPIIRDEYIEYSANVLNISPTFFKSTPKKNVIEKI